MESKRMENQGTHIEGCSPCDTSLHTNNTKRPPSVNLQTEEVILKNRLFLAVYGGKEWTDILEANEELRIHRSIKPFHCNELSEMYRDAMAEALGG